MKEEAKIIEAMALAHEYGDAIQDMKEEEPFSPGITPIPASGKIVGGAEVAAAVEAAFDMHFTEGRFTKLFEANISKIVGRRYAAMCNSGSSANLLALNAVLDSHSIPLQGSDIITPAAGFPTTIAPAVQAGLGIRFCDVDLETLVPTAEMIEEHITPSTRILMMAHTLGNPAPMDEILDLCAKHGIVFIEDNCDALGSTYKEQQTGTFGVVSTLSLYPAHHITAGEGGVVFTDRPIVDKYVRKYRDWGRACWCAPGEDNTCGKRFEQTTDLLPEGYDHKYIYDAWGYNLKSTDFQAAIANEQLERLPDFIATRKMNFKRLWVKIVSNGLEEFFILPKATPGSNPSWFGFPLTIREDKIDRTALINFLTERKIGIRLLFAGNILRQPVLSRHTTESFKVDRLKERLPNTETIVRNTFWIGLWPGITEPMIEYIIESLREFCK